MECYVMQREDIGNFANTLADGFSRYHLFEHICNGNYSHEKMRLFWEVSLSLLTDDALCIADSKDANSVLIYIPPRSKEPGLLEYIKGGGVRMLCKLGVRSSIKLLRFDFQAQAMAKRCKKETDGYLMAFATRLDKQGQHYGKPLMETLLHHLDKTGEGCYLETLKATNVDLYRHFSFQLIEEKPISSGILTMYAMRRPNGK